MIAHLPTSERKPLINCSHRFRYVYVEMPDADCPSINRWLHVAESTGPEGTHRRGETASPTASDHLDEAWNDASYLRFTFIRNPFTRILRAYLDDLGTGATERERRRPHLGLRRQATSDFHRFLLRISRRDPSSLDVRLQPQAALLGLPGNHYDRVYRFENLEASLRRLSTLLDLPSFEENPVNIHDQSAAAEVDPTDYYGNNEEALVTNIYADDFRLLGYRTTVR